jgi:3-dehydroquinate dehydratase/shikimate dehydrogenase
MKICVPITANNMVDAIEDIQKASDIADLIELRLDYITKPILADLLNACKVPAIVTNRAKEEGGHFEGTETDRIGYLKNAIDLGAAYIDIELRHFVAFEKKNTKVIVSYHDFEKTPNDLEKIYDDIADTHADIIKLATKENSEDDVVRMVRLLTGSKKDMIGICIGELGKRTRLHTANYLTFASLSRKKGSVPSQFTVHEIKEALQKAVP